MKKYYEIRKEAMEVLRQAELLLKKGWTQGAPMRDASGEYTEDKEQAESYCLTGAIWATEGSDEAKALATIICFDAAKQGRALEFTTLIVFNDQFAKTQEEVIGVVQKARGL